MHELLISTDLFGLDIQLLIVNLGLVHNYLIIMYM